METEMELREEMAGVARWWWVFIVAGVIWLWLSLVILRFDTRSVTTIGILIGVLFTVAAINEFVMVAVVPGGWKIWHIFLAIIFVLGAIWGYSNPKDAFWALASVLGFLLVLYGAFEITESVMTRALNPLWWLGLTVGILLIALGFWAGQQLLTVKASLLIFYVGLAALFRGIAQIVFAFRLHHAGKELAAS
jgi:uncharacterized membrane protein HdeD (DUF308 family)